ncbi:MAG: SpoIIE family protein phosphatase [Acidobacteriota bacterium]
MHPVFGHRDRLLIYLAAWLPLGGLLASVLFEQPGDWPTALALALPLGLFYAFVCLAAWYPSRSNPLRRAFLWHAAFNHLVSAVLSTSLWQLAGSGWARLLESYEPLGGAVAMFDRQALTFITLGLLFYLLAAAGSYLFLSVEQTLQAERQALAAEQKQKLAEQELGLARALQRRLLPEDRLDARGVALAARNLAAQGVAGDFYDYFSLEDGSLRLAVADVAGKGMAASLIMATVKAQLPILAPGRSVTETLRELNRRLESSLERREFVALALARFDPASGRLEIANAGLPDPYILRASGAIEVVEVPQPRLPLGIRRGLEYRSVELVLEPGDRVLMLTDGLPEAPVAADQPLGYEALLGLLDHRAPDPHGWLETLLTRVRAETLDRQDDDWTALVAERAAP